MVHYPYYISHVYRLRMINYIEVIFGVFVTPSLPFHNFLQISTLIPLNKREGVHTLI